MQLVFEPGTAPRLLPLSSDSLGSPLSPLSPLPDLEDAQNQTECISTAEFASQTHCKCINSVATQTSAAKNSEQRIALSPIHKLSDSKSHTPTSSFTFTPSTITRSATVEEKASHLPLINTSMSNPISSPSSEEKLKSNIRSFSPEGSQLSPPVTRSKVERKPASPMLRTVSPSSTVYRRTKSESNHLNGESVKLPVSTENSSVSLKPPIPAVLAFARPARVISSLLICIIMFFILACDMRFII